MTRRIDCSKFRDLVDDLVGKDLRPESTAAAVAHARACLSCARAWKAAADRAAAFGALAPEALEAAGVRAPQPGATADAVFARLAAGEGSERWTARWSRRVAAAAVVAASAVAGFHWTKLEDSRRWSGIESPLTAATHGSVSSDPVLSNAADGRLEGSGPFAGRGRELRLKEPAPTFFGSNEASFEGFAPLRFEPAIPRAELTRGTQVDPSGGFVVPVSHRRPF